MSKKKKYIKIALGRIDKSVDDSEELMARATRQLIRELSGPKKGRKKWKF